MIIHYLKFNIEYKISENKIKAYCNCSRLFILRSFLHPYTYQYKKELMESSHIKVRIVRTDFPMVEPGRIELPSKIDTSMTSTSLVN